MKQINGVNLGNWLVLEKWMNPVMFSGTECEDETWLCRTLPHDIKVDRYTQHRATYITERDFAYIASKGLNTVRIPVPYFIFGDVEPFVGCVEYLDKAFNWSEKYHLQILIDLHTVPGSQNGFDNGGICGVCKWSQNPEAVEFTLTLLERLAQRYGTRKGLWGIEILNEPISEEVWNLVNIPDRYPAVDKEEAEGSGPVPSEFLRIFYVEAYHRMRKYLPTEKVIVFHDGFRLHEWKDFMREEEFVNVVLDTHLYLMIAEVMGCEKNLDAYIHYIDNNFAKDVAEMQAYFPVIVGEWCLFNNTEGLKEMKEEERKHLYMKIANAQLQAWEKGQGQFYWSYKLLLDTVGDSALEGWDSWDMGKSIEQGWLPDRY
ncbi:beta-glucosidase [Paenibacillus sp. FSL H8-0548]|uniref:glycoside hydrolase family 5 protein n=1 Tax=Paenibacillus sp. FSL H8-0548 TaxID=1920422 RepID=UPI00096CFC81|nr:cellulase family glycosylhydrolase [Paenibacillus sp. FSL H8-0548]OMF37996.1 beta-glucosidase [Paenibacillus sp. FSL H8-0548]